MSALKISIGRKRHHFPEFRDNSDSDSDDLPPRKKHKDEDIPLILRGGLQRLTSWFSELNSLNKFARMALRCGASQPPLNCNSKDIEIDSEEEEEDSDEMQEDDDIQEIKENVKQEKLSPLIKQFGRSYFSSDSGRSKQQLVTNGSYSLGYNSSKLNGASARELKSRCHGTTNCNLRREQTDNLKRQPLISNPPTDIEVFLENELTLEGDGIEILSESPSSKQSATSQKSFHTSVKSTSKKAVSSHKQMRSTPTTKSSVPRSYTANDTAAHNNNILPKTVEDLICALFSVLFLMYVVLPSSYPSCMVCFPVVRLQEKEQYKLLLEKYVKDPQCHYHYVCKKPQSEENTRGDSRLFSNSHFKKTVLEQPIDSFIEKYYTPCRLLSPKAKNESSEKKKEPETVTIDDDDEDIQIIDMKLPKYKAVFHSKLFTKDWLSELGEHVRVQTEERNKIVEDYERKLEKYKKERLLRRLKVDVPGAAVEPEFPELTPEMEDAIDNVLHTGAPTDLICKTVTNNNLVRKDFETLQGLHWLNDTIINSYFDLIVERSKKEEDLPSVYAFNTFFYSSLKSKGYSAIRRWTRKVDIFSFDLNFVPIHLGVHWCLAVIDHRSKRICYYDSMGNGEEVCLDILHDYLCQEYKDKKGQILDPSIYVTETMKDIPQQMNGSDCGMFTLKYAEYISRNSEITFDQEHMQYFRRRTVYELLTSQFL